MLTTPYGPLLDELRQLLHSEYDDGKRANLEKKTTFIVDDRSVSDYDAQGKLFLWFCTLLVDADSPEEVFLRVRGGIPWNGDVRAWCDLHAVTVDGDPPAAVTVALNRSTVGELDGLADAVEAIVAPGRRYETASWKYVAPRTAKSLRHLRRVLSGFWSRR